MRNNQTYLKHIFDAVETIEEYIKGVSFLEFEKNKMMVDAVIRQLAVIGEASNNLSDEFKEKHADFFWRQMRDMRNFLVHDYFGVSIKVVWDTCKNDLPELKEFIGRVL